MRPIDVIKLEEEHGLRTWVGPKIPDFVVAVNFLPFGGGQSKSRYNDLSETGANYSWIFIQIRISDGLNKMT